MKKITDMIRLLYIKIMLGVYDFLHDEKGDTNFLSIMIILGIVLVLAVLFFSFKDRIVGFVEEQWGKFTGAIQ